MAYQLYSSFFDPSLKNLPVTITNKWTGFPAIIMQGSDGGVISTQGVANLDDQARLSVYIDTAQDWNIRVMDTKVLPYNIIDPKQFISPSEISTLKPIPGKTYVLDQPPYTEYFWDGVNLIPSITAEETRLVQTLANPTVTNITYDSQNRMTGYIKNNIQHLISYPDANTIIMSNDTGANLTIALDDNGNVISIT